MGNEWPTAAGDTVAVELWDAVTVGDRRFPVTDEEVEELRERVRAEHAAYMRKWAGWTPTPKLREQGPAGQKPDAEL